VIVEFAVNKNGCSLEEFQDGDEGQKDRQA